ncbi:hypothetical protein [Lactobacillus delbrueckii]|uniref:hypothetical protein n=1 Tax=Lactobacillus delbrueckii TaxID=1584 RepID=UPI001E5BD481|nr:hypothetical protein [Lactobacillus delbrueckii]MCD5440585.1 hypothetical protein [Lactobacillus delbrueckii subsp. lactis]MCD5484248.1 hypothetical protein [Lactobacillus delbrueckii subsp. lactis]
MKATWQKDGFTIRLAKASDVDDYYFQNYCPLDKGVARLTGCKEHFTKEEVTSFFLKAIEETDRYFFLIIDPNGKIIGESVISEIDWDLRRANFRISTGLNWTSSLLIPARKKPTCGLVSSGREFCGMQFSTGASTLTTS